MNRDAMMSKLMQTLSSWQQRFTALPASDRRALVLMFAVIALATVYLSLSSSWRYQQEAVGYYREMLQDWRWMNVNMKTITARLGAPASATSATGEQPADGSLLGRVTASAKPFAVVFKRYQPEGDDGLRLWIESVPFDSLLGWLNSLEQKKISLDQLEIERLEKEPGMVNARLLLRQG